MKMFSQKTEQEKQQGWFQQDGATAHTARFSLQLVMSLGIVCVISRGLWPPRSPNLTPDFYLWGKLKDSVYADNPRTTDELKQKITSVIQNNQNIKLDELECVFQNTQRRARARLCLQVNGAHFQQLLQLHESILNRTLVDKVFNKKFVEIGRVAYIVTGPYSGRLCAIIDIIDQNKALVVGPVTGVPLLAINFKSLHLTRFVLNFRHSAKSHEVKTAWERKAINRRWKQSQWAKKIESRDKKAKMTDFDRFKLMRAKQSRNKIIRLQVGKLRKKPLKDVLPKTKPPSPKAVYKRAQKSKVSTKKPAAKPVSAK